MIARYGKPYFIKIDVEGAETKVLAGLHEKIPYLSFECMIPDFKPELLECLRMIEQLEPKALFIIAMYDKLIFPAFLIGNNYINGSHPPQRITLKLLFEWINLITNHPFLLNTITGMIS